MDLNWTQEYIDFRTEIRNFLAENKHWAPSSAGGESRSHEEYIKWQALLIENGYAARTIPKEFGGAGRQPDPLASRIIGEEFSKAKISGGIKSQGVSMLVPTLLQYGTLEQKQTYIAPTLRGEMIWCQGYSEPGAGSDLASLRTKGEVTGNEIVINGQKIWTSTANIADMMFCLVRTDQQAGKHAGISYVIIPMDSKGLEVHPLNTMTGYAEFNEVFFSDVTIPVHNVVAGLGEGWTVANNTLKHERGMLGDPDSTHAWYEQLVSLLQSEKDETDKPLIENPMYLDRLMKLQAQLVSMRCNSLRLFSSDTAGEDIKMARLVVKLNGCELNHQIAALAIDALDEIGVLYHDSDHSRMKGRWQWQYMFQLGLIIGGGTAQIQKNIISERGLNMPRKPVQAQSLSQPGMTR